MSAYRAQKFPSATIKMSPPNIPFRVTTTNFTQFLSGQRMLDFSLTAERCQQSAVTQPKQQNISHINSPLAASPRSRALTYA